MGKSEYFEVRKVEGEVEQPQIILDAESIYDLLLRAELMMTKVDRIRYANEGYKHNDILIRKCGFKFNKLKHKDNDKTRNRRAQECACLSHP